MDNIVNTFYDEIKDRVRESEYFTEERLELKPYANHHTIRMCEIAVIKIIKSRSKAGVRLEAAKRFLGLFKLEEEMETKKSDPLWAKIPFHKNIVKRFIENAKAVFEECYQEGTVESFGCCSRYMECSNQKKCIHPDIKEAQGCIYKHNLEEGRIFYGKNCTVSGNKSE